MIHIFCFPVLNEIGRNRSLVANLLADKVHEDTNRVHLTGVSSIEGNPELGFYLSNPQVPGVLVDMWLGWE